MHRLERDLDRSLDKKEKKKAVTRESIIHSMWYRRSDIVHLSQLFKLNRAFATELSTTVLCAEIEWVILCNLG